MTRERAAEILEAHNAWRRGEVEEMKSQPGILGEAIDLAIEALRESAEPAGLTKEQYIRLSNIFHKQYDEQSETETGDIPTASFTAVVGMVEEFLKTPGHV